MRAPKTKTGTEASATTTSSTRSAESTSAGTGTPFGATMTVSPSTTAMSRSPRTVDTSVVTSSGAEVPIATMVRPTISGNLAWLAAGHQVPESMRPS
jgi:hypothetical protein